MAAELTTLLEPPAGRDRADAHHGLIFRYARDIILFCDESGGIIEANEAACAAYGYTAAELQGMHARDLRAPVARPEFEGQWEEALRPGGVLFETVHRRKDGSPFPVEISARGVGIDGRPYRIAFLRDISDRKRNEEDLRVQQDLSRQVLDQMLEGCQIIGFDWRYRYLNHAAQLHNRRPNAELLGALMVDCWPGITETEVFAAEVRAMHRRESQELETEFVFPDGSIGWFRLVIQPVLEGIAIYSHEITDRKRAERELRDSEERLRLALEAARMGTFEWKLSTNQLTWSPCHAELFGYGQDEFDGAFEAFTKRVHPEDLPGVNDEIMLCLATKARFSREYRVVWPDGSVHWIAANGRFQYDDTGQPVRMLGVVLDVTEREQADQEIYRLNAELREHAELLERRVAERTMQLEFSKTTAEAADRAKTTFLNTVSHELRTPMNAIVGFTDVLLDGAPGPLNDEQQKQLGIVQVASHRLLALINDVLDVSRIEAGTMELAFADFDLAALLVRLRAEFQPQATRRGLELQLDVGDTPAFVHGDEQRVEQVLNNLMSNALKFTTHGSVSIELERRRDELAVTVADSGIGIQAGDMSKLFRAFSQIDATVPITRDGSGLGLAITKHLVEAMGGHVEFTSTWGEGSRFTFTLPAAAVGATRQAS